MPTKQISPTAATAATRNSTHPGNDLRWQTGQILHGKVMQEAGSEKFLRIGRHNFAARGMNHLSTGQALKMEVIQTGELPVLRLLQSNPAATLVNNQRLQDLPKQTSLLELLSFLNVKEQAGLTTDLKTSLAQFVARLPAALQLQNADGLRQIFQNSGLFLEQHLSHSSLQQTDIPSDLKAALLILRDELKRQLGPDKRAATRQSVINSPPPDRHSRPRVPNVAATSIQTHMDIGELLDTVESALSRHRLNQLESLPQKHDASRIWLMEIPLKDTDNYSLLQIRIEQDNKEAQSSEQTWTIELGISIEPLGPIHAKLTLIHDSVSVSVWVEQPKAEHQLQQGKDLLLSRLRQLGLKADQVQIFSGYPPQKPKEKSTPIMERNV